MKKAILLSFSLCCLITNISAQLSDDFNDGVLDANKWVVETIWYNSEMYETGGEAVFVNRGDITSKAELPSAVIVEGRVRLSGSDHDLFNIRLRSGATVTESQNCVIVQFAIRDNDFGPLGVDNIAIYGSAGGGMVKASYPFVMNTYYNFKVVDNLTNVTVFIGNTNVPVVSLSITNRSGFHIGFNNREGVGSISRGSIARLDYISATPLNPTLTDGLVAFYPFEGNANDASGKGNNATPAGNYLYLTNGITGGALRIIGDNSLYYAGGGHVLLPTFGSDINSVYTFSMWVKDEVIGVWPVNEEAYIAFGSLSLKRAEMWINSSFGGVKFAFDDSSGTGIETNSIATDLGLTWPTYLSSWKHLVFTYSAGVMSGYVNGQKRVEVFRSFNIFPVATAALGRHWWDSGASSSARMSCTYDNVRIYNRALSSNEVAQLYAIESPASGWVVSTLAGSGSIGLSNGPALQARFNGIDELKVLPNGSMDVLVVDAGNNNVRSISGGLNPEVDVYAGSQSGSSGTNLGAPHDARFNLPLSVALGATGQVYVADTFNHRIVSIAPGTRVVSLLAGSGVAGITDGAGASASFDFPNDLAVDSAGNVFVSEFNHHVIRKITPAGQVTLFAGDGLAGSQDGAGFQARFNKPGALAIDLNDNLYVGEYVGNRVRKITPAGLVTTVAGSGVAGYADGMGTNAQFDTIASVCVDTEGNLYVGDLNRVIRQITPSGLVQTIAGTGAIGFADGPGKSAVFRGPAGLGWHPDGSLLVADDSGSERIRRVAKVTGAVAPSLVQQPVSVVTAAGGTVVFKTAATGSWPLSYQWQKDGVNLLGENGPSLLLTNVQPTRIGDYAVIVVNGSGSATSSVASVSIPGVNSGLWQGLVGYYPFNGNANDESGFGNETSINGAALTTDRLGDSQRAYSFDGINDTIVAPSVDFHSQKVCVAFWFYAAGPYDIPRRIVEHGGGSGVFSTHINAPEMGRVYGAFTTQGQFPDMIQLGSITTNVWHHLAITYDPLNEQKERAYLDGQLVVERPATGMLISTTSNLEIGSHLPHIFRGGIDEVRLYNRALSANDVAALYALEFPDADKDGISDYEEVNILGTDPNKSDTDGDGLTDFQEVRFRNTNPTLADTDGDGFNDYAEVYTAHDPLLNTDYPAANLSAFTAIELEFVTKVGTTYQLQTSPDLVTWTNFDNAIIGDGNLWKKTYPTRGQGRLFHRVESAP